MDETLVSSGQGDNPIWAEVASKAIIIDTKHSQIGDDTVSEVDICCWSRNANYSYFLMHTLDQLTCLIVRSLVTPQMNNIHWYLGCFPYLSFQTFITLFPLQRMESILDTFPTDSGASGKFSAWTEERKREAHHAKAAKEQIRYRTESCYWDGTEQWCRIRTKGKTR